MIYLIPLQTTGLAAGLLLLIAHAIGFFQAGPLMKAAVKFPRSRLAAAPLLLIAAIWSFLLVRSIDLGEFSNLRNVLLIGIVVGAILAWIFVPEFLAVRALGMLLLLAAEPLLESAVLRTEPTRLLLVVLAYGWVIAGLFFVGMPYLLRDAIDWVTVSRARWNLACIAGILWGAALVACALLFW